MNAWVAAYAGGAAATLACLGVAASSGAVFEWSDLGQLQKLGFTSLCAVLWPVLVLLWLAVLAIEAARS